MPNCLFCKIIRKEIPADIVYENDSTIAFLDINPTNPGHTLVLPKKHAENILDIDAESWGAAMETVRHLAPIIFRAMNADGLNVIVNNKRAGHQLIDHSHIHLIPRHERDGIRPWHGKPYKDGEAVSVKTKIMAELNR